MLPTSTTCENITFFHTPALLWFDEKLWLFLGRMKINNPHASVETKYLLSIAAYLGLAIVAIASTSCRTGPSCYFILCYIILCYSMLFVILFYILLCYSMLFYIVWSYFTFCYVVSHYFLLLYVMLFYAILCCVMLHYIIPLLDVMLQIVTATVIFISLKNKNNTGSLTIYLFVPVYPLKCCNNYRLRALRVHWHPDKVQLSIQLYFGT